MDRRTGQAAGRPPVRNIGGYGFDAGGALVVAGGVVLVATRKLPLPIVLAQAALAGVVFYT